MSNTTLLDGTPSSVAISTLDLVPLGFDFTPNLGVGEQVSNPSSVLTDLNTKQVVTITDSPTVVSGSPPAVISQEVRGAELIAKHSFRLAVSADIIGVVTNKRFTISVVITCPY